MFARASSEQYANTETFLIVRGHESFSFCWAVKPEIYPDFLYKVVGSKREISLVAEFRHLQWQALHPQTKNRRRAKAPRRAMIFYLLVRTSNATQIPSRVAW